MFGPSHYHPTYGGPFVGDVTRDIIDGNVLTLIVSNSVATSVMTDFMVVTVNDGPDATRFSLVQDSQILDLSVWEFSPGLSNAFGTFPGDVIVFGRVPDLNNDGSIDDLFISAPSPGGQSFVIWGSPPDTVPFTDDATYRLRWLVSNEGFESPLAEAPDQRFRVSYGFQGGLGSIVHVAEGIIAPPPASGETMYTMLFEELEVASANATTVLDSTIGPFGGLTSTENSKRLFWDWIDLNKRGRMADQVGGGMLTLKSVVVERISSSALLAGAITELDVSNFMQGVEIDRFGGNVNLSSADIAIAYASDEVSVSSVGQTSPLSPPYRLFGVISLALDVDGIATLPFVPTDPAADRLYRAEFRIEAAGNGAPVPQIRLSINSFHEERLVNGLATSLILNAVRNGPEANEAGVTGDPNPALEAQTYSTYLALPSTASLDPNSRVGDRIQASVCLIDQDDPYVSEGAIRVTGIRIDSIPMDALP
jgi:hypothetical protein